MDVKFFNFYFSLPSVPVCLSDSVCIVVDLSPFHLCLPCISVLSLCIVVGRILLCASCVVIIITAGEAWFSV